MVCCHVDVMLTVSYLKPFHFFRSGYQRFNSPLLEICKDKLPAQHDPIRTRLQKGDTTRVSEPTPFVDNRVALISQSNDPNRLRRLKMVVIKKSFNVLRSV